MTTTASPRIQSTKGNRFTNDPPPQQGNTRHDASLTICTGLSSRGRRLPGGSVYILLKIAGKPGWWLVLFLIPFVNIVIMILIAIGVAKAFGQSAAFGVFLLFLLCGIGYLILGFGKNYRYIGTATAVAR